MPVTTESIVRVLEPATEEVMAELPKAGPEEADAAIARAKGAFPAWRAVAPADRADLLRQISAAIRERLDDLARLEARNVGKPISDARAEVGMVADVFGYYAGAPERLLGSSIPVAGGIDVTFREPLGVVGLITPWNFPLAIASWKVAPALAAGNTIVLKPAELTPLTAVELERIVLDAGLPEGVLNVVVGPGRTVGERIVEHPDVAKVAFTGSTAVGRRIQALAADTIKRVTLELGGKSANVIFGDADLERAAQRRAHRGVRQRGPGLLRALAHPRRGIGARPLHGRTRGGGRGDQGGRPARRLDRDGTAHLRGAARDRLFLRRRRRAGRDPRQRPRGQGLLVPAHGARAGVERRPRRARGDLRPGCVRHPVQGRGGGDPARQRHDLRSLRLDLDARRSQGVPGSARDRKRGGLDQLEHLGARLHARSAASSSRASAASSARTRSTTTRS